MGTQPDTGRLKELSLFSGAGGGLLGSLLLGWRTVCCVEWNEYCQRVLRQRMQDGWLDGCPIWDDVRTFDGRPWRGRVDVLTAGFPCQPFSVAGKQGADKDGRNMWPDTARILREVRPPLALLENVPGLTSGRHGYFGHVLGELAESGYDAVWDIVPASAADAPHERERLWVLCVNTHTDSQRLKKLLASRVTKKPLFHGGVGDEKKVADTDKERPPYAQKVGKLGGLRSRVDGNRGRGIHREQATKGGWQAKPDVGRLADGVAYRVDRLKALGNGQVPQQMALAWSLLSRRMLREMG